MWFVLLTWLTALTFVSALSDDKKQEKAVALIKDEFHKDDGGRKWKKEGETNVYSRFECNTRYKTGGVYWRISLHVHPEHQRQFDRIYAFEYKAGGEAFMGAVKPLGQWKDYNLVHKEQITRPECQVFCHKYEFNTDHKIIVISNFVNQLSLRTNNADTNNVNFQGGLYEFSNWDATLIKDGPQRWVKLKNKKSDKFLRFNSDTEIDATGSSGTTDNAVFKVHKLSDDFYRLESKKFPGKFIRVTEDGKKVSVGNGSGDHSKFKIWRKD